MRRYFQYLFLAFNIYIGIRLYLFYIGSIGGAAAPASRPPSVEAYLPIAALISLKYWVITGIFDQVHPAGLVILLSAMATALVARRGFCSWVCPIGTLSEIAHRAGRKLGVNIKPPGFVDIPLRSLKYLGLAFFALAVAAMDAPAMRAYIDSPFNKIADVKMLLFFMNLSAFAVVVLFNLVLWSFFIKNFWCRYLCPYGALLAVLSKLSLVGITRNEEYCIDCKKCDKACPAYIEIAKKKAVRSLECIDCLDCIDVCPVENTLEVKSRLAAKTLSPRAYGLVLVGGFMLVISMAQLTGHWKTGVSAAEYRQLLPAASSYRHP